MLFVSGRGGWGLRREFITREPNTLQYGALIVKIHENTFGEVSTEYRDVFSGDTKKSGRIVFGDKVPAERGHVLVEVYPEWSKPSVTVYRIDVAAYHASANDKWDRDRCRAPWLDSTAEPPQPHTHF